MIQTVRGTFDILPDEVPRWRLLEETARAVFRCYGYREIRTPIFERTELFARSVGEETDIVAKEMYTFTDRGGESLSLRPESTASVIRAYIQHKMWTWGSVVKLFYLGPQRMRPRMTMFTPLRISPPFSLPALKASYGIPLRERGPFGKTRAPGRLSFHRAAHEGERRLPLLRFATPLRRRQRATHVEAQDVLPLSHLPHAFQLPITGFQSALGMMHDDEHPIRREHPRPAREAFEHLVVERRGVWRVEEDHVEDLPLLAESFQSANGILLEDLDAVADATGGEILPEDDEDRRRALDERDPTRPTAERFDPHRSRPRAEIEKPRSGESRSQDIEERFPQAIGGRPNGPSREALQASPLIQACDHAHGIILPRLKREKQYPLSQGATLRRSPQPYEEDREGSSDVAAPMLTASTTESAGS